MVRPKGKHQATIVWLHGLGDNGSRYFFSALFFFFFLYFFTVFVSDISYIVVRLSLKDLLLKSYSI